MPGDWDSGRVVGVYLYQGIISNAQMMHDAIRDALRASMPAPWARGTGRRRSIAKTRATPTSFRSPILNPIINLCSVYVCISWWLRYFYNARLSNSIWSHVHVCLQEWRKSTSTGSPAQKHKGLDETRLEVMNSMQNSVVSFWTTHTNVLANSSMSWRIGSQFEYLYYM